MGQNEVIQPKKSHRILKSTDCLSNIISFLDDISCLKLQILNRFFYNKVVPKASNYTYNTFMVNQYALSNFSYEFIKGELYQITYDFVKKQAKKTKMESVKDSIKFEKHLWTPSKKEIEKNSKKNTATKSVETWCADKWDSAVQIINLSKFSLALMFKSGTFL